MTSTSVPVDCSVDFYRLSRQYSTLEDSEERILRALSHVKRKSIERGEQWSVKETEEIKCARALPCYIEAQGCKS